MRKHFLVIGVVGSGLFLAGVLMGQNASQATKSEPPSAAARLAAAERVCRSLNDRDDGLAGHLVVEHRYVWSMRWMEAQRDVDAARGDGVSALEAHARRMRELADRVAKLNKDGVTSGFDLASTQYYVAEAEELLARERAK